MYKLGPKHLLLVTGDHHHPVVMKLLNGGQNGYDRQESGSFSFTVASYCRDFLGLAYSPHSVRCGTSPPGPPPNDVARTWPPSHIDVLYENDSTNDRDTVIQHVRV